MRKPVKASVAAAGLAAALALTGCGGGDSGNDGADKAGSSAAADTSPGTAADATPSAGAPASGSGPVSETAEAKRIEGAWKGLTDGGTVALSVLEGKAVLIADQHVCSGSVQDMGEPMLVLTCSDGNTDRAMGAIESNDGKTLVLSWGAKKDTLKKADPAKLPGGLPTNFPSP
ncbi:hypothetical protein [Streptomyces sp. NPDC088725]|uniref:hypothetical protein n=1 Tax=Streptomyces sp. NPDC088725 TaxID=3365873 RepID=UPI00380A28D9